MRIVCPQCGYSREIPANKIPTRSSVATCPKCRFRFRFREDSPPAPVVVNTTSNEPAYPPRPSRPSPTPSPEDMRPTPPPYISPRGVTYQPLPDDVWEPQPRTPRTLKPTARWLPDPEPGEEAPAPRQPETDRRGQGRDSGPWPDQPPRSWVRPEKSPAGIRQERDEQPRSWRPAPKPVPGRSSGQETDAQAPSVQRSDAHISAGYEPAAGRPHDPRPGSGRAENAQTTSGRLADTGRPVDSGHLADTLGSADSGHLADPGRLADFGYMADSGHPDGHEDSGDTRRVSAEATRSGRSEAAFQGAAQHASVASHFSDGEMSSFPPSRSVQAPVAHTPSGSDDEFLTEDPVTNQAWAAGDTSGRDASGASLSELGEALRGAKPRVLPAPEPIPAPEPPKPPEPDFWESARQTPRAAHEATTGDEPVRDIWARLQAMGGDPAPSAPPGKEGKPKKETSHMAETAAPWDEFEHMGVAPAFLKTARNVLFKPGDFFEALEPEAGRVRPLIFDVVVSELVALFWMIWKFFGMGPAFAELTRTEGFQGLGVSGLGSLALLGLAPVLMLGFSYLDAALSHFLLGLLRGVSRPFEATFRTLCYAGAPWLLAAAPVPLQYLLPVVVIWHMTLQAIGLKKQHKSGYSQVLASVLVKWSFYLMVFFAVYVLALRR